MLIGGATPDVFFGEAGNDVLIARDGHPEVVACGDGFDIAYADPEDALHDCEITLSLPLARVATRRIQSFFLPSAFERSISSSETTNSAQPGSARTDSTSTGCSAEIWRTGPADLVDDRERLGVIRVEVVRTPALRTTLQDQADGADSRERPPARQRRGVEQQPLELGVGERLVRLRGRV